MHTRDDVDPLLATAHRTPTAATPAAVERAADDPGSDARAMLELQRMAGNASVSRLIAREPAGVPDEAEAGGDPVARSPVLDVVGRGGGEPLAPEVRAEMEGRLGADFGGVRVHHDAAASESAKAVGAHAYTVGSDVVFRSDRWDPSGGEGRHTLAHELSHVVQQANGPVAGSPAPGGIRVSSPDDDFEKAADRQADVALARPTPSPSSDSSAEFVAGRGSAIAPGPSAQLEPAGPEDEEIPEDEDLGADTAQREAAPEDELDEDEAKEPPKGRKPKEGELEEEEPIPD